MASMSARVRAGFTLIEMLIVLAIIVTLASMILFGASALGIGSKKAKTGTILAAVRKGIELTIANKGGSISPVEHPFAGSKRPAFGGFRFKGWRGRGAPPTPGTPSYTTSIMPGTSAAGSYTLKGVEEWWVTSNKPQIFMDDDLFDDADKAPGLFAMPRGHMGLLGSQQPYVTEYWRMIKPKEGQTTSTPYAGNDLTQHVLIASSATPDDNKKAIDYLFGSSNVQAELSSLKAMFESPTDPTYAAPNNQDHLLFGLVWSQDHDSWDGRENLKKDPKEFWEPGRVKDTAQGNSWRRYRMRGLAIYDAWDREIFYSYGSGGGIRLLSLGADGAYRFDPGPNRTLDTNTIKSDPTTGWTPDGDDKDGLRDNVSQEVVE